MTDYKNLKLIASSSPHIRSNENTRSIMLDVIIAMLPALVWAIYNFGFKALISVAVSVVACLFWEWLYRKLLKKPPGHRRPVRRCHRYAAGLCMPA